MTSGSTIRQMSSDALDVHLLGVVDYAAAAALQQRLVYEISGRSDRFAALLLCEHPPHISIGRDGSRRHLQSPPEELERQGVPCQWVARGGGCISHAPGQLAAYLMLPLDRLALNSLDYRQRLETAAQHACRELPIVVKRNDEQPGLWCRGGQVGCFGGAVRSGVSYHGLYLNVDVDPSFLRLVQTDPGGQRMTTLSAQRLRRVPMNTVREAMIRHVAEQFDYSRYHLYTGHPLLQRTRRRVPLSVESR